MNFPVRLVSALRILFILTSIVSVNSLGLSDTGALPAFVSLQTRSDPGSHLDTNDSHKDGIFTQAVQILDSMKSSPSCHRIAATKLVTSCQEMGGKEAKGRDEYEMLDQTRSVYAARLAICELEGAGSSAPSQCRPLTVPPVGQRNRLFFMGRSKQPEISSSEYPKEVLELCLKTLESRPQWWISYSNNRQNAMVICQAARMESEKDELLNLHRSIVDSNIKLNEGLHIALQKAAMESARNEEFFQAVQALQDKLLVDLERNDSAFQRIFAKLLRDVEAGINSVAGTATSAMKRVQSETTSLEKDIEGVSSQVTALQEALSTTHEDSISRNDQSLRVFEEHAVVYQNLASDLHFSLESLMGTDLQRVSKRMVDLDTSLEWLTSRLIRVLEHETELAERLKTMGDIIDQSTHKANELQTAQQQQAEALAAQSQAHREFQLAIGLSQALLDKTAITAANLQATIQQASARAQQIPQLGGFSLLSLGATLVLAIGSQYSKVATSLLFLVFGHKLAVFALQHL
ncbi:hypothetical protein N7466_007268 [Penicillium verhagenii]|uniref:uncharacterized protein n=1 Tax=Penicillium verhagenii TaxID=1562060 RepID=UPI0025454472|nr:uncharacterized protein N7466_007268 [Penicillium verhagenii]KAJ5928312.1 hypothetical protein N7466_007268 [Penicillium verhagenii]